MIVNFLYPKLLPLLFFIQAFAVQIVVIVKLPTRFSISLFSEIYFLQVSCTSPWLNMRIQLCLQTSENYEYSNNRGHGETGRVANRD